MKKPMTKTTTMMMTAKVTTVDAYEFDNVKTYTIRQDVISINGSNNNKC